MSIISDVKDALELASKFKDRELYEKIVSLREQIQDLREENISLREERDALKKAQEISSQLVRHDNCYYMAEDTKRERPYCMVCWGADRRLIEMHIYDVYNSKTPHCEYCDRERKR